MQVLLVDDNSAARKVLRKILERYGCKVTDAENGLLGIAHIRRAKFDLVMADIFMPVMNGLEFIKVARKLEPRLRIIAMSGGGHTGNMESLEMARRYGASAIVYKPLTMNDVRDSICQCLGSKAVLLPALSQPAW